MHIDENNQRSDDLYCVELKNDFFARLHKAGRLPIPTTDSYFREIEKVNELEEANKELKEEVKSKDDIIDNFKSTYTSIAIYEDKFQEMNAKDQQMQTTLK